MTRHPGFSLPADWPSGRNSLAEGMSAQTHAWLAQVGLTTDPNGRRARAARKFDPGSYAALVHPMTTRIEVLQATSDYSIYETLIDDEMEVVAPAMTPIQRLALADSITAMLRGEDVSESPVSHFAAGWADIGGRLLALGKPYGDAWASRFLGTMERTFRTVVCDGPLAFEQWLDEETYTQVRPWDSNLLMYLPLAEVADDAPCPPRVAADPRHVEIVPLCGLIFALMNDSRSAFKEDTGSPTMNSVLIRRHHTGSTIAESVAYVSAWHGRCVARFETLATELNRDYGEPAARYLAGMRGVLTGITEWTHTAPRYTG